MSRLLDAWNEREQYRAEEAAEKAGIDLTMPNAPQRHKPSTARKHGEHVRRRHPMRDVLYGRRWKEQARHYLAAHPLCAECERQGRLEPATCVDHIEPHRFDPVKFGDVENWQSLCVRCHNLKTGRGE